MHVQHMPWGEAMPPGGTHGITRLQGQPQAVTIPEPGAPQVQQDASHHASHLCRMVALIFLSGDSATSLLYVQPTDSMDAVSSGSPISSSPTCTRDWHVAMTCTGSSTSVSPCSAHDQQRTCCGTRAARAFWLGALKDEPQYMVMPGTACVLDAHACGSWKACLWRQRCCAVPVPPAAA